VLIKIEIAEYHEVVLGVLVVYEVLDQISLNNVLPWLELDDSAFAASGADANHLDRSFSSRQILIGCRIAQSGHAFDAIVDLKSQSRGNLIARAQVDVDRSAAGHADDFAVRLAHDGVGG